MHQPYESGIWGKTTILRNDLGEPLPSDAPASDIFAAYSRLNPGSGPRTLRWMLVRYMESGRFAELAPKTQTDYADYAKRILDTPNKDGSKLFGEVRLVALRRKHFIDYHATRPPVIANLEIQFVRGAFTWAIENEIVEVSPAHGFRLNSKKPRDRYITDAELKSLLKAARDGRAKHLAPAIELAYLLRARANEVLTLRRADLTEDGIHLRRSKGSDSEITLWTPRLRAAVKEAQEVNKDVLSPYLLHTKRGKPFTYSSLRQAFTRARERAGVLGVHYHDLKAKGITDHKEHAGGHKSAKMREIYVRLPDAVEATR